MIRVLVVEDDPIALQAHAAYVERVEGFEVAGKAAGGQDALRRLAVGGVDLILLDLGLPDVHGLDVCRALRAAGHGVDVIAVTSARDLAVVRAAVSQGVVAYLLKPFVYAALRDKLERYAAYRAQVSAQRPAVGQQEVDRVLATLRTVDANRLPKGMSPDSLERVVGELERAAAALSAAEVGGLVGLSRVAARRYLEYLCDAGQARRTSRHGGAGRPEIEYARRR